MMEDVLGFCASVLMLGGLFGITAWLCCSIVEVIVKTKRRLKNSRYDALLKENERLRGFLADAEWENSRLRGMYYFERTHRKSKKVRQSVA